MFDPAKFRLDGQVALVTGAGAGIGRGIAEMFAGAGASVVVSDLKKETADEVAKGITEAGGKAVGLACNVTKEEDLQAAVQAAIDNFGSLSILVNNALCSPAAEWVSGQILTVSGGGVQELD
jgi:7-alpha-hydroxysteroid dehydrogenase